MSAAAPILWAAAGYNLAIGLPPVLARATPPESRLTSLLVACFGLVYAIIALDPVRYAPVLWAGIAGKLGVIALLAPRVARGEMPRALGWVLAGDAVFVAGFLWVIGRGAG